MSIMDVTVTPLAHQAARVWKRAEVIDRAVCTVQAERAAWPLDLFESICGLQDLIDWLNEEAIAIVVITNGHPDVQRGKLAASGIDKLIKHILVGGEETRQGRPEKPAASIFLRACSLAGCQPHEVKIKQLAVTLKCSTATV